MDFIKLQYFVCFCECGSITGAAQEMHITAQGISKAILSLEEECGVALLNRNGKILKLTPEGLYFLEQAKILLRMREETLDHLLEMSGTARGNVKIGLAYGVLPAIGMKHFSDFQKKHAAIQMDFSEMEDTLMEQEVIDGRLHLGFTVGVPNSSALESHFLQRRNQVILCSIQNPISCRKSVTFSDLKGQKVILLKDTFKKNHFIKERLLQEKIDILPISGISEMNTILALCRENAGIGICAQGLVSTADQGKVVEVPFDEPDFFWDIHLIYSSRSKLPYPAKLLYNYIVKQIY